MHFFDGGTFSLYLLLAPPPVCPGALLHFDMLDLERFQKHFIRRALAPDIDMAVLSLPRGNGKTHLAAHILARCLTPGDELNVPGAEYLLCSASIEQSRMCYRPIRQWLDEQYPGDYRFIDSVQRIGITHKASGTRLRVMSSSAKTTAGIVGCPIVIADEPGCWEVTNGRMMFDMIETAKGKSGSPMRSLYVGTVWPARAGWWPELVGKGSHGRTYVQALIGDVKKWDQWPEIRRVNPLISKFAASRRKLLDERDAARGDTRLMARFASTRLNHCMADESSMLLSVDDWELAIARTVPPRAGRPVLGVDCGAGRSWTAAVAVWPNGRTEAWALAPGIPDIEAQETRDRVPRGTYRQLVDSGLLTIATGRRVPPLDLLADRIREWRPTVVTCDRFRLGELQDALGNRAALIARIMLPSECDQDIRALRAGVKDGPLSVAPGSRALIQASLAVSEVEHDKSGNCRITKRGARHNCARDDVSAAWSLAAGLASRRPRPASVRLRLAG